MTSKPVELGAKKAPGDSARNFSCIFKEFRSEKEMNSGISLLIVLKKYCNLTGNDILHKSNLHDLCK